jgi:hypothetical protein
MFGHKFWIKGIIQRQTMQKTQSQVEADGDVSARLRAWSEGELRRAQPIRDRRSAQGLRCHRDARLERRKALLYRELTGGATGECRSTEAG